VRSPAVALAPEHEQLATGLGAGRVRRENSLLTLRRGNSVRKVSQNHDLVDVELYVDNSRTVFFLAKAC
jgi:hypothetical protein